MIQSLVQRVLWERARRYTNEYHQHLIGVAGGMNTELIVHAMKLLLQETEHVWAPERTPVEPRQVALALLGVDAFHTDRPWWRYLIGSKIREVKSHEPTVQIIGQRLQTPGAMDETAKAVAWQTAVIPATQATRLDLFQNTATVAHEQFALAAALPSQGLAILCADDPNLMQLRSQCVAPVVTYGYSAQADVQLVRTHRRGLLGLMAQVRCGERTYEFHLPHLTAQFQVTALLPALALWHTMAQQHRYQRSLQSALYLLQHLRPVSGQYSLHRGYQWCTVFDHTVFASPESIFASLQEFAELQYVGRKMIVLADVPGMGAFEQYVHHQLVEHVGKVADVAVLIGPATQAAHAAIRTANRRVDVHQFLSEDEALPWVKQHLSGQDHLLITGHFKTPRQQLFQQLHLTDYS